MTVLRKGEALAMTDSFPSSSFLRPEDACFFSPGACSLALIQKPPANKANPKIDQVPQYFNTRAHYPKNCLTGTEFLQMTVMCEMRHTHYSRPLITKSHHPLDERRQAVPEPAVELRLYFSCYPPEARDGDEARSDFRERGHVPPELLEPCQKNLNMTAISTTYFL